MRNHQTALLVVMAACMAMPGVAADKNRSYKQAGLPIETRVNDLLGRMTLEEKIGQLRCTPAWNYYEIRGNKVVPSALFEKEVGQEHVGMLWGTYRADPWTQKSLGNGLTPELAAKAGNAMQKYVMEKTRLGIPLFLAEEAPHGHMAIGTTVFPTGLGMAATWSPALIEQAGRVIAGEIRRQGGHISYGPVLDLSRDPRWSRVEESMGEDPVLSGTLGASMVKGLGGGRLGAPDATLATLKHFIGYGTTEGGQNGNPTFLGLREIHENFLPPFKRAVEAGALSVMTSYNSLDGIPCTANDYFLKQVLHRDWRFRGFVVSDLYSIDGIWQTHHVAATRQEAGAMAMKAGVDVDLGAVAYGLLADAYRQKQVDMAAIDTAVARVLRLKFEMGLFDHPYVDPKRAREVRSAANKDVAYRVARASVTLLKNEGRTLPLDKHLRVAVVGPNADNDYNQLGDYTAPQAEGNVKTVLDGISAKIGADRVEYVKGCAVRDTAGSNIAQAVEAARRADVVVAVVGGSSARDFKTNYQATGAAVSDSKSVADMDCGEGFDRATLSLLGRQNELLQALRAVDKPLVVIYIEGRPLEKNWAAAHADALLTAYYPGQEGGRAIADVLFGDYSPAGRLPVSVPVSVGQLPVYYNKKAPVPHNYVEMSAQPLYAFGYGLSYTTFDYGNLAVKSLGAHRFEVSFDVTNTGDRDGEEVAQLYLHDDAASTVRPLLQLKHFERAMIAKGAVRHFSFVVDDDDLSIVNRQMQREVEPGTFSVLVGSSSDRIKLRGTLEVK